MKEVAYSETAVRALRRIPRNQAERITAKIKQYAGNPRSLANNIKALKGSAYIRLRVGDWRVIMDDQGTVLHIVNIGPRGSIYG